MQEDSLTRRQILTRGMQVFTASALIVGVAKLSARPKKECDIDLICSQCRLLQNCDKTKAVVFRDREKGAIGG